MENTSDEGTTDGTTDGVTPDCSTCRVLATSGDTELLGDHLWFAASASDRPGWLWLGTRRHGDWAWDLTDAEAETLGPILSRLSQIVRRAAGVDRVYILALGENTLHFHMLLIPRIVALGEDVRAAIRGAAGRAADPALAGEIESVVRAAWARQATGYRSVDGA